MVVTKSIIAKIRRYSCTCTIHTLIASGLSSITRGITFVCGQSFLLIHHLPKFDYSSEEIILHSGFDLAADILLQLMPKVLNWVEIRRFGRCSPPGNVTFTHPLSCMTSHVFRIIVLHELVTVQIVCMDERNQHLAKYLRVQFFPHDPLEKTHSCSSSFTNSCPNMDFHLYMITCTCM